MLEVRVVVGVWFAARARVSIAASVPGLELINHRAFWLHDRALLLIFFPGELWPSPSPSATPSPSPNAAPP